MFGENRDKIIFIEILQKRDNKNEKRVIKIENRRNNVENKDYYSILREKISQEIVNIPLIDINSIFI